MTETNNLANLIKQRKYLKEKGWKEAENTNNLLEQFLIIEEKIANTKIKTRYEAYLQLNLLQTLWREVSNSSIVDNRKGVIDRLFKNLLEFFDHSPF